MKIKYGLGAVTLPLALLSLAFIGANLAQAQQASAMTPTIPKSVSATVTKSNQVYVSWQASTETSTVVSGYYLYRNGNLIASTPGNTYYTDTPPAGVYSYTVSAYDKSGNVSALSKSTVNVSVISDTVAPSTPTDLVASISTSSVALSWTASTDNAGVIGYYVYQNGQKMITKAPITATTYLASGLSEGTSYTYTVSAYDAAGNISNNATSVVAETIFDVQAPTAPQGLSAQAISSNEIDLSWQAATDNVGVSGYYVYRNKTKLLATASTTYKDTGVTPGTTYGYSVYAYDEAGNVSAQGPQVSATSLAADKTPPSTPSNFMAVPLSGTQVQLSWSASTDNLTVTDYYIHRNGNLITTTASTTYLDTSLASNTTYEYVITATDAARNISPQASLAIKTLGTPTVVISKPPVGSSSTASSSTSSTTTNHFMTALYYGLRSSGVQALQLFLVKEGYLSSSYATGYYGNLTVAGVQKFQCAQNIICSGSAFTTGWGLVGPKTRAALNSAS